MSNAEVAQEKKWQREDDARTLARAEEIRSNKKRLSGAIKEATAMARKAEKEMAAIKKIAKKPAKKKPANRKNGKK